jgi:abortive infection bacteriophage resistance protein
MLPLKVNGADEFLPDTTFDNILNSYLFDRELRILVFDAVEKIEIAFRTQIIYQPSLASGPFWYENPNNFLDRPKAEGHLEIIDQEVERSSETFITHHRAKYFSQVRPPSWMAFEVASLGLLSKMAQNIKDYNIRTNIAAHFGLKQYFVFESWMQSIVYVRNICAHHSRLWNRILTIKPQVLQKSRLLWIDSASVGNDKLYYFLCCLVFLSRQINPETAFVTKLRDLFAQYPETPLAAMGFPPEWSDLPFWQ